MSTRSVIYSEQDGVEIFADLFDEEDIDHVLNLEYRNGPFLLTLPLSKAFSQIIKAGMREFAAKMNAVDKSYL